MSSTLVFQKTPKPDKELGQGIFGKCYYDHDGSCGGGVITIDASELEWLRGIADVMDAPRFDKDDIRLISTIIKILEDGDTVDMWFEV